MMLNSVLTCVRNAALTSVLVASSLAGGPSVNREAARTLSSLPVWFEPNAGRFSAEHSFVSRHGEGTLFVGAGGALFQSGRGRLRLRFSGGAAPSRLEGEQPAPARSSYLVGSNPALWKRGLPQFAAVRARDVYPGIDVAYHFSGSEIEFDVVVAPGARPEQIRMSFSEAGRPRLDGGGDLLFPNGLRQKRPVAFQEVAGSRRPVRAAYRVGADGLVSLQLGAYDRARSLVIDPVLTAGYLGGDSNEIATAVAVDAEGNVWVTGSSASTIELPSQNEPVQDKPKGKQDVFLAKLTPDSSGKLTLAYWTQLGGASDDQAEAIRLDPRGNVVLAGSTSSTDFPQAGTPLQSAFGGEADAFIVELRPSSSGIDALWFSQYYGGDKADVGLALDIAPDSAIYVVGYSTSGGQPGAGDGSFQCCNRGGYEGFLVKVLPDSSSPLVYGTFIGGNGTDVVTSIAVSTEGLVYLAGYTGSAEFPVSVNAANATPASGVDAFLMVLDFRRPGLDALVYATYLGGDALDVAQALAFDGAEGLWMAGYTLSRNFPVTAGAVQATNAGGADIFAMRFDISKLGTDGQITYSTLLGGSAGDVLTGFVPLARGRVALAGYTYSAEFPKASRRGASAMAADAFLSVIDPGRPGDAGLVSSTLFSGASVDYATGIAADSSGRLYLSGATLSTDFPVTDGSRKKNAGGMTQSFFLVATPDL